ncbi:MAG: metallophosphoesterase [Kiritimatiellae bacterium]|nr:metallophosphoesterase [Kiritimatiellia bacterium]
MEKTMNAKGMMTTRRGFLGGTAAWVVMGAHGAIEKPSTDVQGISRALDPEAIGFISDLHVGLPLAKQKYKTMRDYPHQPAATQALVREILALPRPPANVLCLGDISLAFAEPDDYAIAAETLKPLTDAGIQVTCAMGNHDIRSEFLKYFPGYDKTTKVPGRFVSVVNTPHADFILLDSLVEPEPSKRGNYGACTKKGLGKEQLDWLLATIHAATRPTFLCAHHPAAGLGIPMSVFKNRIVPGYLHGHTHQWTTGYLRGDFDENARMLREVGIPTLGFEWDVGWGLMRTTAKGATLFCNARDFYYPLPKPKAERPAEWDMHVRDWADRSLSFSFV